MTVALAVVVAALIGAAGPWVLRRLPEPPDPDRDPDKIPYAVLAARPLVPWALASAAALMAGIAAWAIDDPELVPVWVLVTGVGTWLAYIDWHTRLLPFAVVSRLYLGTLLLVAVGALLLGDADVLVHAIVANVVVYVIFRVLHWVASRFLGGAFGYGDVRLAGVLALALGALGRSEVLVGIYAGFVLGAVLGVVLTKLRIVDPRGYAFGPYMLAGAVIGTAWGPVVHAT